MITFFTNPDVTLSNKLLEIVYIIAGLVCYYSAFKHYSDKNHQSKIGTVFFWAALGTVMAFGRALPPLASGIIVVAMTIPAMLKKVTAGNADVPTKEYTKKQSSKIGMKIFIPALCSGIFSVAFALMTKISSLVGITVGVTVAIILLMIFNSDNKPKVFLDDSTRLLSLVGPLSLLPILLAALGSIFTAAGVGTVVAGFVGNVVPQGNLVIGIIVYALSMTIFTAIMGNAFAAITVMTAGIGYPFVLAYGVNPVVVGMLALTCGYCGTLLTPMAANFNIVPVAVLDMKDKYGVIKKQAVVAVIMLVFQICYMLLFK